MNIDDLLFKANYFTPTSQKELPSPNEKIIYQNRDITNNKDLLQNKVEEIMNNEYTEVYGPFKLKERKNIINLEQDKENLDKNLINYSEKELIKYDYSEINRIPDAYEILKEKYEFAVAVFYKQRTLIYQLNANIIKLNQKANTFKKVFFENLNEFKGIINDLKKLQSNLEDKIKTQANPELNSIILQNFKIFKNLLLQFANHIDKIITDRILNYISFIDSLIKSDLLPSIQHTILTIYFNEIKKKTPFYTEQINSLNNELQSCKKELISKMDILNIKQKQLEEKDELLNIKQKQLEDKDKEILKLKAEILKLNMMESSSNIY